MLAEETSREVNAVLSNIDASSVRGKRILVAGGAGFIGSWVCDVLVSAGARVLAVDNLSSGFAANLEHLRGANLSFRELDVSEKTPNSGAYDYVLHLASRASPEEYQSHPTETLLANSLGTRNLLEVARRCRASFLYASTSEVYGDASVLPTPETYWGMVNPTGPRSCYDEGKRFGEALCVAYQREHDLDVRIARIFNTYGPRIRADGAYARVIPRFVTQALMGADITVHGNGRQTRSFCYMTDTVTALIRLLTSPRARGELINVGNPEEISIMELANKVKSETNSRSKIIHVSLPPDDPKRRLPDVSKAKTLLGWRPRVSLDTGIARTVGWFARITPGAASPANPGNPAFDKHRHRGLRR